MVSPVQKRDLLGNRQTHICLWIFIKGGQIHTRKRPERTGEEATASCTVLGAAPKPAHRDRTQVQGPPTPV